VITAELALDVMRVIDLYPSVFSVLENGTQQQGAESRDTEDIEACLMLVWRAACLGTKSSVNCLFLTRKPFHTDVLSREELVRQGFVLAVASYVSTEHQATALGALFNLAASGTLLLL